MNNENNKINDDFEMIENSNMNLKLKKQFFSKKYDWNNYGYSIINNPYVLYDNFPKQKKYINILNNVIFNEGVSNKIRPKMYLNLTGAKMEKENHKNYYFNLINNFPKNIPNKFLNIIETDLNRTFIENEYFHNENNLNKLKNILVAYSRRNSKIGYCQGFNFIVGKLLLIFDYENNENNNKINENKINENKINENNNKIINENSQIEECNRNWPFCTQKSKDEINEVLILKVFNQTNIIKNFFENQNKIKNFDNENKNNIYNNLLILREKHECKKNSSLIIDKDENLNKYNRKLTKVLITNKKIKEKQNFNILKDSMIVINNFFMENEKINENKIENEE